VAKKITADTSNKAKDQTLIDVVTKALDAGKHEYLDMQNYINISYYIGQQWISWDESNKRIFIPEKREGEVRFVSNKINPIIRRTLSKLTKNKPISDVMPASSDDVDIEAAHLADKVSQWLDYNLDLGDVDKQLIMWAITTTNAFAKPFWNPNIGISVDKAGTKQGDIDIDVISAFDFVVDPTAKKWDEVKWVCQKRMRSVTYIKDNYGVEVSAESNLTASNIFDMQLKDLNTIGAIKYNKQEDSAIVKEYWELPTSEYPNGRRITIANGVLLFESEDIGFGPDDKTERELPYFPCGAIDIPGRFWTQSVIELLIPLQREINRTRSKIIENINLMAHPPWISQEGALSNEIEGGAGEVIEYKLGFAPPHMEQMPSMSADVYKSLEMMDEDLEYLSGMHEFGLGRLPAGVRSAQAIAFLQEEDDTMLGPIGSSFERCKEKYTSYCLKIVQLKYDIPRTVNLVNKTNQIEAVTFKGADLTSTNVRVVGGSAIPLSKTAKQAYVMDLVQNNVLNPQTDKELILKMLEMGFTDDMYDEYAFDVNHALAEQDKWRKGILAIPVRDFFNHVVHIEEHNKFRKSDEYEKISQSTGGKGTEAIDFHINLHEGYAMGMSSDDLNNLSEMPVAQQTAMLIDFKSQIQQQQPPNMAPKPNIPPPNPNQMQGGN
jgi:hypothetical protein